MFAVKTGKLKYRIEIKPVELWQARYMLESFHYLQRVRTGRQINYAVIIDGVVDGVITYAYPMTSSPIDGVPSDELLEFARLYLHQNIPHSASCAIGKSLRTVKGDWARKYPDAKPVKMVVSWSDTTRHQGTVYKASNFCWLKRSKGAPPGNKAGSKRGMRAKHGDYSNEKDCWVYRLG